MNITKANKVLNYLQNIEKDYYLRNIENNVLLSDLLDNLDYLAVENLPKYKLTIIFPNVVYFYDTDKTVFENLKHNEEFTDFLINYFKL